MDLARTMQKEEHNSQDVTPVGKLKMVRKHMLAASPANGSLSYAKGFNYDSCSIRCHTCVVEIGSARNRFPDSLIIFLQHHSF